MHTLLDDGRQLQNAHTDDAVLAREAVVLDNNI